MTSSLYESSKEITILEILDRVLNKGVVITGDIILSVADIDLVYVGLRVLLTSVETIDRHATPGQDVLPIDEAPGQCLS